MNHAILIRRGLLRQGKRHPQGIGQRLTLAIDIDELHLHPSNTRAQVSHQRTHDAAAHDTYPLTQHGVGIPHAVDGGFHVGGQHRPVSRYVSGHRHHHGGRDDIAVLVGVKTKYGLVDQRLRAMGHAAYAAIPVFDRARELPHLKGRAHTLGLAARHTAMKHQRLGTSTDAAVKRTHTHIVLAHGRERFGLDCTVAWASDPKGLSGIRH